MASDDSMADDDELIVCQACHSTYDRLERLPKFLDCHHCYCLACIKGFRQSKQAVFCLKCRAKTNLAGRQLDDLGTNHYVLRLIDAGAKLQQLQADSTKVRSWCTDCVSPATADCAAKRHAVRNYEQLYSERSTQLEARLARCPQIWDQIIVKRRKLENTYRHLAAALEQLQQRLQQRLLANKGCIGKILSYQEQLMDWLVLPSFEDSSERHATATMHRLSQIAEKLEVWEDESDSKAAQTEIDHLTRVEQHQIRVEPQHLKPPELLSNRLQYQPMSLSFSGAGHRPPFNGYTSLMSLLVLLLNEEVTPATPPAATPSKPATAPDERATLQAETRSSPAPTAAEPAEPMYCPMIIKTESLADSAASFTFTEGDGSSPAGGESTRADNVDASESENSSSAVDFAVKGNGRFSTVQLIVDDEVMVYSGRPWKCTICGKAFQFRGDYNRHLVVHSAVRTFTCPTCGLGFKRKDNFNSHLATHSMARPFKCQTCNKTFKRKADKEVHERIHTGERAKEFRCSKCNKGFYRSSTRNQHERVVCS